MARCGLRIAAAALTAAALIFAVAPLDATSLETTLGRNEVRIYSAPYRPPIGSTVVGIDLSGRLERLGYTRVRGRPEYPGEYFWGHDVFWLFQRQASGRKASLVGWRLEGPGGRLEAPIEAAGSEIGDRARPIEIEPELIGTSFRERRAASRWVAFESLPEHAWRSVLAIEDSRFMKHSGIDGRAIARALLANARAGGISQGASTITQQLIKLRDLSPKRSVGRKASEAIRALALEAAHSKEEILEGYLNLVYYGHLDGVSLYGIEAAAHAYYSTAARDLDLPQSAALAALVQAPNRLSPVRNPEALAERYQRVLDRMEALAWASPEATAQARRGLPRVRVSQPTAEPAPHFRTWVAEIAGTSPGERTGGLVVATTLDGHLQRLAEEAVEAGLARLRRRHPDLANRPLNAALVALDATSGRVLAYVGGNPAVADEFDRARSSRRQPGSTVKPLVALEALGPCGDRPRLFASRRVLDEPLTLQLESGDWSPQNADRRFRGPVTVHRALAESLNVPTVRLARHCGLEATARRLRRAGLQLPEEVQPAFVLGAVETSPLELATAYSLFANRGRVAKPKAIDSLRGNRRLLANRGRRRAASPAAAWLVRELLARPGADSQWGKTGTSSDRRDAWYAGGSGRLVVTVWVGLDDNRSLGLGGATAAEPIWLDFVAAAVPSLQPWAPRRPGSLSRHWVDVDTGLRLRKQRPGADRFWFDGGARPPVRRFWRRRSPLSPID